MESEQYQIWPVYQFMYIESMLVITSSAIDSTEKLKRIYDPNLDPNSISKEEILDWIQNIFTQAAALSRYFWTVKKKEKIHKNRSAYLRKVFGIKDHSPLKNRDLRNMMEHFDEYLDEFITKPIAGTIIPCHVGIELTDDGVPKHIFRAFYNRLGVFEVMGHRYELQPVVDEIYEVHRKLSKFAESGYVMKSSE